MSANPNPRASSRGGRIAPTRRLAIRILLVPLFVFVVSVSWASAANILFDATKHEMGGNADWVVDADVWDLTLPAYPCTGTTSESNPASIPTPPQAGITGATVETYWTGAVSAWAVELAKAGHTVEILPPGGRITHGDGTNPQDLSRYQLFIVVEPQNPFGADEKSAILSFVASGGGLFVVADHETSDRDCDGWDSPHVWNDLAGATSSSATGVFGFWFRVNGISDRGSDDWFDDAVDANVETDPSDPIIRGPFGEGTGGLGFFGATSMELNPADNPTVKAHVWRTGQAHGTSRVTFATASYGGGRVAAIGDSSPADDGTGDAGDTLYPGWDKASGGVRNREIHLNACAWLLHPLPDVTPPTILTGPGAAAADCAASIVWTTDEAASSTVEYGPTIAYGSTASAPGFVQSHSITLVPLAPSSEVHFRVSSSDVTGNGPTVSSDATFTTAAAAPPSFSSAPTVSSSAGTSALVAWTTDEPSTSEVQYGATAAYGDVASVPGLSTAHAVPVSGLTPSTTYHFRAVSVDACGNGPSSSEGTFATGPASLDVSGFTLKQYNSVQTYTIPAGTSLPAGGYLVIGRNASRAQFDAYYPAMPPGSVYLDSNANGSCPSAGCFPQVNGGESFELYDASATLLDGPTVAMSSTHSSYQRIRPGDPAGSSSSWSVVPEGSATPGQGAGAGSGSGVRIGEMSDAADYTKEFIELYYDAAVGPTDTTAPAAVIDLVAVPVSPTSVRLAWTASGDDGTTGSAASYDIRTSPRRILTASDFAAAVPLSGEPAPSAPGSPQQMVVSGLSADVAYHFALVVSDEVPNASAVSNDASAVTAPSGAVPSATHLVISQIQTGGTGNDVVEIYNPTPSEIPLSDMSVQYLAANGNFGFRVNLTGTRSVPSHGWYLVAANGYAGSPARDDSLGTQNASANGGHLLLVAKTTDVSGCSDAAIVDRVGYYVTGTVLACPEGGAGRHAPAPAAGLSITRKPGGASGNGQDTDTNSDDFLAPATPVFRSRSSAPATPPPFLGNVRNTLFLDRAPSGAELTWGRAAGATGYRVYRGTTASFMGAGPAPWQTPTVNAQVDPDAPSPIFFYVVRATDGISESED